MNTSYGQITLSKVNDGASPTAYNLIVSHAAVVKSQNGEYNPSSITLSSKSQTGSDAWDDYAGRFTIDTTEDNTTWTNRYTSGVNENTKTYEISPSGWSITDSEPYLLRKSAGNGDIKSMAIEKAIVGGSVVWNQLIENGDFSAKTGWACTSTWSATDNTAVITVGAGEKTKLYKQVTALGVADHKFIMFCDFMHTTANTGDLRFGVASSSNGGTGSVLTSLANIPVNTWTRISRLYNGSASLKYFFLGIITAASAGAGVADTWNVKNMQAIDLTLMFGPTVADYIYSLETATAGAGVAWCKAYNPKMFSTYQPYNAGTLISVKTSAHKMVGKNLVDPSAEVSGYINGTNGTIAGASSTQLERASDYIQIPIGTSKVYFGFEHSVSGQKWIGIGFYRSDKTFISRWATTGNTSYNVTVPSDTCYVRVSARTWGESGEYLFLNLKDNTYEPYKAISYPLDSRLTLRGILKLDGNNKLYYDGDEYPPSGEVKRRYHLGNLGTLNWTTRYTGTNNKTLSATVDPRYIKSTTPGILAEKYIYQHSVGAASALSDPDNLDVGIYSYHYPYSTANPETIYLVIGVNETPDGSFIYELATPTTESATPYTTSQVSYAGGTEEYITDGIPVGHVTKYSPDITGIRCSLYLEKNTTTLLDQQTVPIVSDGINGDSGKDAYTVLLTNESHTFAGGKTAAVGGQTATIGVVGYRGTVQRATTVGTITGAPTGMTTAISNNSTTSTTVTVSVTSSMTTKNGTLTIPVTVDGTVFNLIFSYAIAFTGASGVGTTGLGWKVNATGLATTNNGECYFYGYNDQNQEVAGNGWVMWNGVKLTIEGGTWINPDEVAPYNTSILHVYRTSGSTPALRHCDVWWDSTTGKWMGYNYSGNNTTPAGKAEWVWNEATDCILATYVEPSKEGKIVSAQLFNPPKKFSELPDPKVGFDLDALDFGGRNMFLKEPQSYNKASYCAYTINLTEFPVAGETYTVQLWDVDVYHSAKTAADTGLDIYWGGGSLRLMWWHGAEFFTYVDDPDNPHYHADYLEKTITITQAQADHANAKNKWFEVYNSVPSVDGTRYMYIGKWKMEKGDKPTYWNLAPEDAATTSDLVAELIVGTHSKDDAEKTGAWTGTSTKIDQLKAGTRIQYKLPYAGKSGLSVTLNLTLADGTETGVKNVFYSNTTRLTNQYGQNAIIDLVYDGSAWRILNPYTNSDTVGVYGGTFKTGANGAKRNSLLMKDTEGTWTSFTTTEGTGTSKPKYTGGFLLSDLMYFSSSTTQSAGIVTGTGYKALALDFRYSSNCGSTLVSGQEVYIVGEMNSDDHMFHLDDTWWTQTEPTTDDGKTYIYVGIAYNTTSVYLSVSNPAMQFYNGEFLTIEKIETIKAQEAAEEASKVATNYLDFNEQTGLDVGYSGTQAKTRISGDGVEIFDAQGVSMQEISSRTEEVDGQSVQVPFVRTGYTDQGHVETSSGGIDIKYGPEDTEYHTDLIAHLGYGDTVADPTWGEAQPGEIVQAPFYSFGPRALSWEDNDNVDHDADVGQYSFVTGKGCVGGGPWSYVGGYGNVTLNDQSMQTVVGVWNDPSEPGLFVVGAGSHPAIGQRKNALVVGGQSHAVMIHGDTYVDGGLTANPKSHSRTIQTVSGITVGSLQVYTSSGWCAVTLELTSKTTLSDWTTIATGMPIPAVTWYDTMTNWENTYHRPYRVAVTTSGNLNIRYGAGSSSDATAYRISFVYPMAI